MIEVRERLLLLQSAIPGEAVVWGATEERRPGGDHAGVFDLRAPHPEEEDRTGSRSVPGPDRRPNKASEPAEVGEGKPTNINTVRLHVQEAEATRKPKKHKAFRQSVRVLLQRPTDPGAVQLSVQVDQERHQNIQKGKPDDQVLMKELSFLVTAAAIL